VAPTTTFAPLEPGAPARRISRGKNGRPVVALSFDAGSDVGYTADILDVLAAEGVKASFGVTGKWAEKNPDLFRRIVAEGHHVINHTYDHASMTGRSTSSLPLSRDARISELARADDVFVSLTGKSTKPWFRPPYGDIDTELDKTLVAAGYSYDLLWSVDSLGWKGLSAADITTRCVNGLDAGVILLFHVGSQSQDDAALPAIIAAIRHAGLQPGSIPDVL
jgi:peptidoglycan/xylan/chitin deacetylase (PgdA/CDA1 family)